MPPLLESNTQKARGQICSVLVVTAHHPKPASQDLLGNLKIVKSLPQMMYGPVYQRLAAVDPCDSCGCWCCFASLSDLRSRLVQKQRRKECQRGQLQLEHLERHATNGTRHSIHDIPSNFSETTMTLKCDSAPAGALCI